MIDYTVLGVTALAWLAIICIVVVVAALIIYTGLQDTLVQPRDAHGRFVTRTLRNRLLTFLRGN